MLIQSSKILDFLRNEKSFRLESFFIKKYNSIIDNKEQPSGIQIVFSIILRDKLKT